MAGNHNSEGSRGSQGKPQSGQGGNVDPGGGAGMSQEKAQEEKAEEKGRPGGEDDEGRE